MTQIRKMKLYRLVQNVLTAYGSDALAFESLYYSLGYTSFTGRICKGGANKYPEDKMIEEGKFFYMFPEHALEYLRHYPLHTYYCKFIEYEVPEDYVYEIIGVGEYGCSSPVDEEFDFPKAETYISKSLFGKTVKASEVLTREEKIKVILDEMRKTLIANQVLTGITGYKSHVLTAFNCDDVKNIPDDQLLDYLYKKRYGLLNGFLKDNSQIVKSGFATGRSMIVFHYPRMEKESVNEANRIILKNSCFDFDYTCDDGYRVRDARYEYARLIEQHKYEEAKELKRKIYRKIVNDGECKYTYATKK